MSGIFIHQTPGWLPWIFPQFCWRKSGARNVIHLTFDDGPVPDATPLVLKHLREFEAKATFFCVGQNVDRFPEIIEQVVGNGHSVGNHTYHHLNGWKTTRDEFIHDVARCQDVLRPYIKVNSKPLMRPPYGRLKPNQWRALIKEYQIIMWDVLSGDFSGKIDSKTCLEKSIRYSSSGSIVLFHDSIKTIDKLNVVLPEFLRHFSGLGYSFQAL